MHRQSQAAAGRPVADRLEAVTWNECHGGDPLRGGRCFLDGRSAGRPSVAANDRPHALVLGRDLVAGQLVGVADRGYAAAHGRWSDALVGLVGQKTGHRGRSGRQGRNGPALAPSPKDHEVRGVGLARRRRLLLLGQDGGLLDVGLEQGGDARPEAVKSLMERPCIGTGKERYR
jgi:hypothetical protein